MKFTSYKQMNKKQRAALNKQRRKTWEASPVTKVIPSRKIYDRKRCREWMS